jgi:CHASE2 domain-containing sensor protein
MNRWLTFAKDRLLQLCIAGLLLVALANWPYGYYTFLRLAVSLASAVLAWQSFRDQRSTWGLAMAAIALLFNPFILVHLHRQEWMWIDAVSALVFLMCPPQKPKKPT